MTKRTLLIGLGSLVVATTLFAGCGCGDKGHCGPGMQHEKKGFCEDRKEHQMFAELDLTKEQKQQLRALREDNRDEMNDHKALKKDLMLDSVDANGFNKALFIENSKKLHEEMSTKQAEFFEKAYNILTPEQKAKLLAMKK